MNTSASISLKAFIAASMLAFALVMASGSAEVSAARGGGVNACPDGWHAVTPPLNPVLLCLPDTIVIDHGGTGAPPEGQCPEGWNRATPPLNPVLGCLPGNLASPAGPIRKMTKNNGGTCPDGFRPATNPLNPVLGCIPDNLYLRPTDGGLGALPPGECPSGWNPVTPPLNPLLVCLPGTIAAR